MYPHTHIRSDMCIPGGDTINTDAHPRHNKAIRKYLLLLKEMPSISSNITSNATRVKTGIKLHAKVEYCGARRKDRGGGTPIHYLCGYVPPKGVVILKLLI